MRSSDFSITCDAHVIVEARRLAGASRSGQIGILKDKRTGLVSDLKRVVREVEYAGSDAVLMRLNLVGLYICYLGTPVDDENVQENDKTPENGAGTKDVESGDGLWSNKVVIPDAKIIDWNCTNGNANQQQGKIEKDFRGADI